MIIINKPYKEKLDDRAFLKAIIQDDYFYIKEPLWYSIDESYFQDLHEELSDSFVVAMLLPAIFSKQDIVVEGKVSERLFYTINTYLLYCLKVMYGLSINITFKEGFANKRITANNVGTGCSLGVDSLVSILSHLTQDTPPNFKLTHLTFFNVGALGQKDSEQARKAYNEEISKVKEFANEIHLPLLSLDSNITMWTKDLLYGECAVFNNISAVLSLQGVFKRYYFASSYPVSDIKLTRHAELWETLLLPLLSTDNIDLIVSNANMTRVDKTAYLADSPLARKYLNVCWKNIRANTHPDSYWGRTKIILPNCTHCDKCLRTVITLFLLNKLDMYSESFDIDYFYQIKDEYLAQVIYFRKDNYFYNEIYSLMKQVNYHVPVSTKYALLKLRIKGVLLRTPILSRYLNSHIILKKWW